MMLVWMFVVVVCGVMLVGGVVFWVGNVDEMFLKVWKLDIVFCIVLVSCCDMNLLYFYGSMVVEM